MKHSRPDYQPHRCRPEYLTREQILQRYDVPPALLERIGVQDMQSLVPPATIYNPTPLYEANRVAVWCSGLRIPPRQHTDQAALPMTTPAPPNRDRSGRN